MTLSDGRLIVADATELVGSTTDVIASKIGKQSSGFFFINEEQSGMRPRSIERDIRQSQSLIKELDQQIGYCNSEGYKIEQIKKANNYFGKMTSNDNFDLDLYLDTVRRDRKTLDFDGYDDYGYFRTLRTTNSEVNNVSLYMRENYGKIEAVSMVTFNPNNGRDKTYRIYSKELGEFITSDVEIMRKYLRDHNIKPRKPRR